MDIRVKELMEKLTQNNIQCFYTLQKEDVISVVKTLIHQGELVRTGGSVTLEQCGIINLLNNGDYKFKAHEVSHNINHNTENNNKENLAIFSCDTFFTGCNAITENGEIFNVDGSGNRVAPMIFGSKQVIVVLGINKIVRDMEEAVHRLKTIAAPLNSKRLNRPLYCAKNGECIAISQGKTGFTDGCESDERICNVYSVISRQNTKQKNRIKVIIVGEELGF